MKCVAIVILNYLNYQDTIECVESIKLDNYENKKIIIIDNNSMNNSWEILQKKYSGQDNIYLLQNKSNYGFAKGNNVGIKFAKEKLKSKYILILNNDTVAKDIYMIDKLMKAYEEGVGIIGLKIIGMDGYNQNPINIEFNKKILEKDEKYLKSFKWKLKKYKIIQRIIDIIKKEKKNKFIENMESLDLILHGAGFMITESYFEYYPYLYPKTFLYYEENILTLITKKVGLKKKLINSTYIYHKEDRASSMSFNNINKAKEVYLKESIECCKNLFDKKYFEILEEFKEEN